MIVADKEVALTLTGNGDVIEHADGLVAIGSGGLYAYSAAKALLEISATPATTATTANTTTTPETSTNPNNTDTANSNSSNNINNSNSTAAATATATTPYVELDAEAIAKRAMKIAADICVYTNANWVIETLNIDQQTQKSEDQDSLTQPSQSQGATVEGPIDSSTPPTPTSS